jgi:outer membrane protein assembly factor BamB
MKHRSILALGLLAWSLNSSTTGLLAANWPQWRGPDFNGSSPETGLPAAWSKTEQVAWVADMPGPSAATPVVWEDHVFVSTTDAQSKTLHALCLDRQTGQVRWQHKVGEGYGRDRLSNFASPSPATDGHLVVFFYGNGDLAAFDLAGQPLWSRSITKDYGEFAFQWTFSASPLLHAGKLYLQVLQRDVPVNGRGRTDGPIESFLLAMDPATGKELWRHVRPCDARAESKEAYSTPMPFTYNGRQELLIAGGDCLTGHDPETGRELWRWGTWNPTKIGHWRLVPSPVAGGGVVLACAPKGSPIYAVKAGLSGTQDDSALAWTSEGERALSSDVPTPAFYQGDFFVLKEQRGALSRVDPKTGKAKWTLELTGAKKFEASPTAADGKVYLMDFAGDVFVVDAEAGTLLHRVSMGDPDDDQTRSTISVAHGRLFIRTNGKLWCVGKR